MSKNIQHKRFKSKEDNEKELRTCYYCPSQEHKFCTHPNKCIFDKELYDTRDKIGRLQFSLMEEKRFLEYALEVKKDNPDKDYGELFYNFNPVKSKINIKKLKCELIKLHELEESIITRPGGLI